MELVIVRYGEIYLLCQKGSESSQAHILRLAEQAALKGTSFHILSDVERDEFLKTPFGVQLLAIKESVATESAH